MREFITPEFIDNQIRMRRSAYSGTFIIVEGSGTVMMLNQKY